MEEILGFLVIVTIILYAIEKKMFQIIYKKYESIYGTTFFGKSFLTTNQTKKIPLEEREIIAKTTLYRIYNILKYIRIILLAGCLIGVLIYII